MTEVHSFPPVAAADATRLILGTMPGVASLSAGRYYAHPRNGFWPLLEAVLPMPQGLDYAARCEALVRQRIGLWDVLQRCERRGSLDAAITRQSMVANDFLRFLQQHPLVRTVYFNGQGAAMIWQRLVAPMLPPALQPITHVLPSSSPAHAGMSFSEKQKHWQRVALEAPGPGRDS